MTGEGASSTIFLSSSESIFCAEDSSATLFSADKVSVGDVTEDEVFSKVSFCGSCGSTTSATSASSSVSLILSSASEGFSCSLLSDFESFSEVTSVSSFCSSCSKAMLVCSSSLLLSVASAITFLFISLFYSRLYKH
jgi:hypothetical protein